MATRTATAEWKGGLKGGNGAFDGASGEISGPYTFGSRFTEAGGTNPEELVAAAHAACFSMQFAAMLEGAGHTPDSVRTEAQVQILEDDVGFAVKKITLIAVGRVPGIDDATFQDIGRQAKEICPISRALAAVDTIVLDATLEA